MSFMERFEKLREMNNILAAVKEKGGEWYWKARGLVRDLENGINKIPDPEFQKAIATWENQFLPLTTARG